MLERRQAELNGEVRSGIGGLRTSSAPQVHGQDEDSDNDVQQDIDVAMIQFRAETSRQIDAALERIGAGEYGDCASCGEEIPAERLQALPFAIRCIGCEEIREHEGAHARKNARDRAMAAGRDEVLT